MGIQIEGVKVNWQQTQKTKESIVTSLTKGIEGLFKKNKVTYLKGVASFVDATTMYQKSNLVKL
jgi:dihydrolipoamide dehydrogenase